MINHESLLGRATQFYLGRHQLDVSDKPVPIYLEKSDNGKGWVVRAQLGELNPWYLNDKEFQHLPELKSFWCYKRGVSFAVAEDAIAQFNLVVTPPAAKENE